MTPPGSRVPDYLLVHRGVTRVRIRTERPCLNRLVAAGLTSVLALAGALLAVTRTASAVTTPAMLSCNSQRQVAPGHYVLACADANAQLSHQHWHGWGSKNAHATGQYVYNNCSPSCAAGSFVTDPATVTVSRIVATSHGKLYTRISVFYTGATSSGSDKEQLPTQPVSSTRCDRAAATGRPVPRRPRR